MKSLLLLGSTGSIGRQTLDLVRRAPHEFRVLGLAAASSWERLLEQAREFRPALVALASEEAAASLRRRRISARLPAMSPTVGLSWAMAILSVVGVVMA